MHLSVIHDNDMFRNKQTLHPGNDIHAHSIAFCSFDTHHSAGTVNKAIMVVNCSVIADPGDAVRPTVHAHTYPHTSSS